MCEDTTDDALTALHSTPLRAPVSLPARRVYVAYVSPRLYIKPYRHSARVFEGIQYGCHIPCVPRRAHVPFDFMSAPGVLLSLYIVRGGAHTRSERRRTLRNVGARSF